MEPSKRRSGRRKVDPRTKPEPFFFVFLVIPPALGDRHAEMASGDLSVCQFDRPYPGGRTNGQLSHYSCLIGRDSGVRCALRIGGHNYRSSNNQHFQHCHHLLVGYE